jgi:hypothetical protein
MYLDPVEKTHWDFTWLRAGRHEIKVTVLAGRNSMSEGNHVNLAGFEPIAGCMPMRAGDPTNAPSTNSQRRLVRARFHAGSGHFGESSYFIDFT